VRPGKEACVDSWLATLNSRMPETLATLHRENMFVEVIFRERIGEEEFLSWFSIQGTDGASLGSSPHPIDHEHMRFWDECIDRSYGAHDAVAQVVMVPDVVARALEWPRPAEARREWSGDSTWTLQRRL
jgi:hypothetical protein